MVALDAKGTAGSVTDLTNVCGDTAAHSQLNTRGFRPHRSFMLKGMRMALKPSACRRGTDQSPMWTSQPGVYHALLRHKA